MANPVSPLQVISANSLLMSNLTIDQYVKTAADMGYRALALCDINVMYGALAFYQACLKYHIKPLLGVTLQLNDTQRRDSETNEIILLAKNNAGYQALLKLSTIKMTPKTNQATQSDRIVWQQVEPYLKDLIVVSPTENSYLINALQKHNRSDATAWLKRLQQTTPEGQLYLGVDFFQSETLQATIADLARQFGAKIVLANRVMYLQGNDFFAVETLNAIKNNEKLSKHLLANQPEGTHFLYSPAQLNARCQTKILAEAMANNAALVSQLNLTIEFSKTKLPKFATPNNQTAHQYLRQLCQTGLNERLKLAQAAPTAAYQQRLDHELSVIAQMGFEDYFLIVWDVCNFCHQHDILIGPGRGSAAGALVAYCLHITDVDPLQYHLLFERFLNPERIEMPDIDLDIPDRRRDEVLAYVHQRYGNDKMAQIITFATLGAKQALRDVCRVFGASQALSDRFSRAVGANKTLAEAQQNSQLLKNLLADSQQNRLIFATAQKIEGLPRQTSTHAAGVILSAEPLVNFVPLQQGQNGYLITQYSKDYAEAVGLLKMDFLALSNLNTLEVAQKLVKQYYHHDLKLDEIPLDDAKTLQIFANAQTNGVFQFESSGIKNVLIKIKPTSFEDLVAIDALFRPGPMANIDEFARRKHHQTPIKYLVPALGPILKTTYGIIVYQEQVMQVAVTIANFTLGQADTLRKAIGKKQPEVMQHLATKFFLGAAQNGYSKAVATQIWEYILKFGDYGFNRSHAVAYSKLAFWLAYIKCHFPLALFIPLLNAAGSDKVAAYLQEAKQLKLSVVSPSFNYSQYGFSASQHKIIFGLGKIRTVRRPLVDKILAERKARGKFLSLNNLIQRIQPTESDEKALAAMLLAGAGDEWDQRAKLVAYLPMYINNTVMSGQNTTLQNLLEPKQDISYQPQSLTQKLDAEKYYLGAYVSAHPTEQYASLAVKNHLSPLQNLAFLPEGTQIGILGYLRNIKVIRTKKTGEQMAFVSVEDATTNLEVVVFARVFRQVNAWLKIGLVAVIFGKVQHKNGTSNLLVAEMMPAQDYFAKQSNQARLFLQLTPDVSKKQKQAVYAELKRAAGNVGVSVYYPATKQTRVLDDKIKVDCTNSLIERLRAILGAKNVVYTKN